MVWLRKHPIAAFLPLQALLCFWNLGLLSPWMDEAATLLLVRLPVRQILRIASDDVHPLAFHGKQILEDRRGPDGAGGCAAMAVTVYPYEAFTPLEIRLMRAMGMRDPPAWSHELLEFRRR
jgi:hypothetical protein